MPTIDACFFAHPTIFCNDGMNLRQLILIVTVAVISKFISSVEKFSPNSSRFNFRRQRNTLHFRIGDGAE